MRIYGTDTPISSVTHVYDKKTGKDISDIKNGGLPIIWWDTEKKHGLSQRLDEKNGLHRISRRNSKTIVYLSQLLNKIDPNNELVEEIKKEAKTNPDLQIA